MKFSLNDIVGALDLVGDEVTCFLNRETGELHHVGPEERELFEEEEDGEEDLDLESLPEWQREEVELVREIYTSDKWLELPSSFDIHEWSIMERFSERQPDEAIRDELLDAIHGSGAFRRFKDAVARLDIEKEWYQFREEAFEKIARRWLESHGLEYEV
jgi:hypothetical protein